MRRRRRHYGMEATPTKYKFTPEQRKVLNALKIRRNKLYNAADKLTREMVKISNKAHKEREKKAGTVIEIGRPRVTAEKIKIGGVDLLKLVERVEKLEEGSRVCIRSATLAVRHAKETRSVLEELYAYAKATSQRKIMKLAHFKK